MDKLYTTNEVRAIIKVSESTMRRYLKAGKIKYQMFGRQYRISETDLKEFINNQNKPNEESEDNK